MSPLVIYTCHSKSADENIQKTNIGTFEIDPLATLNLLSVLFTGYTYFVELCGCKRNLLEFIR